MIDMDPVREAQQKKIHDFLNKINREVEYPTSIIHKLIVKKMQ